MKYREPGPTARSVRKPTPPALPANTVKLIYRKVNPEILEDKADSLAGNLKVPTVLALSDSGDAG